MSELPARLTIAFNLDDSRAAITQLLKELQPVVVSTASEAWSLDFSKCRYIGPDAVCIILSTIELAQARGQSVEAQLPTSPPALKAFCAFSGLSHYLDENESLPNVSHPDNETVPVRKFDRARFTDADEIIALIERHTGISEDSAEYLRLGVNEVTQNIEDHANSSVGGYICARYFANRQQVRVAIVDRGKGIATTLAQKHPDVLNAQVALQRVIHGGFSARSRPNNAGLGLSHVWNSTTTLGGSIVIVTGDGIAEHRAGSQDVIQSLQPPFAGTGVFFTLPVRTEEG